MLNWRRDPGYEQRMKQLALETEQLDRENARLENLLSCVDRLCFPPESNSTPPPTIESDCDSSLR